MLNLTALIPTIVGFLVYAISIWATYHPDIRMTRLYWVIGMSAAIVGHGVWTYLAQHLTDQKGILVYALVWDIGFTVLSVLVPALIFRLPISVVGYVGVAMIVLGGLLVKEYGFLEVEVPEQKLSSIGPP